MKELKTALVKTTANQTETSNSFDDWYFPSANLGVYCASIR